MDKKAILAGLKAEEERIRKIISGNEDDFEELQSEWQERDSPAERNLREVECGINIVLCNMSLRKLKMQN